jgi:hypothetical protein
MLSPSKVKVFSSQRVVRHRTDPFPAEIDRRNAKVVRLKVEEV